MPTDIEIIRELAGEVQKKPKEVETDPILHGPAHQMNRDYLFEGMYEPGVPANLLEAPSHVGNRSYGLNEAQLWTERHVAPLYSPPK